MSMTTICNFTPFPKGIKKKKLKNKEKIKKNLNTQIFSRARVNVMRTLSMTK